MNDLDLHLTKVLQYKLEALNDFRDRVFDQKKDPITASEVIVLLNNDIKTLEGMIND